ncbi:MAG TPA: OmpA family protein [Vicinamibacterales bacterium]|jgi:outer membrane protein OmpA-like peptidoglycan-associated protein
MATITAPAIKAARSYAAVTLLASLVFASPSFAQPTDDKAGCQDHPLVTRMPGMRIITCTTVDFDRFVFKTGKATTEPVEGRRVELRYQIEKGQPDPGKLSILRNHQQALAAIGGVMKYEDARYTVLNVVKNGKDAWIQVDTAWGGGYQLTIVEKASMKQEVTANAAMFESGLGAAGHVEIPGIYFDTGKSELKPESAAAVAEVAKLLKGQPAMKVFIVGHTDNVASLDLNTKLSQARAESVVQALVSQHAIAAARLAARGVGPLAPIATNDTEEGRARNRRVELVKQ